MQSNASIVRQFTEDVINTGDMDAAAKFVWEDVIEEIPLPSQGPGSASPSGKK